MQTLIIRPFDELQPYLSCWQAMKQFSEHRNSETQDELWLLQHPPVYTQGLAGKSEHILNPRDIPIVQTDRGGQVTYHGPGQLMIYTLFDIQRLKLSTRQLVQKEQACIHELLLATNITSESKINAPGVYVDDAKIASIGLRIHQGRYCYHGMAFNVDMDLSPFQGINPCGFQKLAMTQVAEHQPNVKMEQMIEQIIHYICKQFGYNPDIYPMKT